MQISILGFLKGLDINESSFHGYTGFCGGDIKSNI